MALSLPEPEVCFLSNEREAACYLAAIIDGEGNVSHVKRNRRIRIRLCEREIIEACIQAADILGLRYRIYWNTKQKNPNHSDYHELAFQHRDDILRIYQICPIRSHAKRLKLKSIIESYDFSRNNDAWLYTNEELEEIVRS